MNGASPDGPAIDVQGSRKARRTRWGTVLSVIAITAVVILAVMGGLGTRDADYPADSPEAALQRYFQAWDAGDVAGARAALSDRARGQVSEYRLREALERYGGPAGVWVEGISGSDDRRIVTLDVEWVSTGFLGTDRWTSESRISMVREDGEWKIDEPLVGYGAW